MLLHSEAMVATSLLVDNKITACDKQIHLLGSVIRNKVLKRKVSSGETFRFLLKGLLSILNFVL